MHSWKSGFLIFFIGLALCSSAVASAPAVADDPASPQTGAADPITPQTSTNSRITLKLNGLELSPDERDLLTQYGVYADAIKKRNAVGFLSLLTPGFTRTYEGKTDSRSLSLKQTREFLGLFGNSPDYHLTIDKMFVKPTKATVYVEERISMPFPASQPGSHIHITGASGTYEWAQHWVKTAQGWRLNNMVVVSSVLLVRPLGRLRAWSSKSFTAPIARARISSIMAGIRPDTSATVATTAAAPLGTPRSRPTAAPSVNSFRLMRLPLTRSAPPCAGSAASLVLGATP